MSLVAFALRACTVRALRGATLAGANVFDSPVDPSDIAAKAATPTIFVFSDNEHLEGIGTRGLSAGNRTVDLSLLIVLPPEFSATLGGTTVSFNGRGAGSATGIDIIFRQIERALIDESSIWSALWCRLVSKVESVDAHAYVLPVGSNDKPTHLPARALMICVEPIDSPEMGHAPQEVWADFVAAMATDSSLAPLAPLISAAIQGDALPQWRTEALSLGDTADDAQSSGYAALGGDPTDDIVPMTQGTVDSGESDELIESYTVVDGLPATFGV